MSGSIDIYENIIKYNGKSATIIIDDKCNPWFSGKEMALILGYTNTKQAVIDHVNEKYKLTFDDLKKYVKVIPPKSQPHAVYINEPGLFSFLFRSEMPKAKEFTEWVAEEVLPSIRKYGSYKATEELQQKFEKINEKYKKIKKENKILQNNQNKTKYPVKGMIYVVRPIESDNEKLFKIGRTSDLNKRLNTYNTSVPDDMEVLFTMEVNDPIAVELCIKGFLQKYIYRDRKEYYECTLKKIKDIIKKCDNLIYEDTYCEDCKSEIESFDHFTEEHGSYKGDDLHVAIAYNIPDSLFGGGIEFQEFTQDYSFNDELIETQNRGHISDSISPIFNNSELSISDTTSDSDYGLSEYI